MSQKTKKTKVENQNNPEQQVDKECATEIEAVLKKFNRTLRPYIQYTDSAAVARVSLARINPNAQAQ